MRSMVVNFSFIVKIYKIMNRKVRIGVVKNMLYIQLDDNE